MPDIPPWLFDPGQSGPPRILGLSPGEIATIAGFALGPLRTRGVNGIYPALALQPLGQILTQHEQSQQQGAANSIVARAMAQTDPDARRAAIAEAAARGSPIAQKWLEQQPHQDYLLAALGLREQQGQRRLDQAQEFGKRRLDQGDRRLDQSQEFGERRLGQGDRRLDQAQEFGEWRLDQGERRLDQAQEFGEWRLGQGDRRLDLSEEFGNRRLAQGDRRLAQGDRSLAQGDRRLDQGQARIDLAAKRLQDQNIDTTQFTPEELDWYFRFSNRGGKFGLQGVYGRQKTALMKGLIAQGMQRYPDNPESAAADYRDSSAEQGALTAMSRRTAATKVFEGNLIEQGAYALDLMKQFDPTTYPKLNRLRLTALREGLGTEEDQKIANMLTGQMTLIADEFGRLAQGGDQSIAMLAEGARIQMEKIISGELPLGSFQGILDLVNNDARIRAAVTRRVREETKGNIARPIGGGGQPQTQPASDPGGIR